jgi:hypothetical protein
LARTLTLQLGGADFPVSPMKVDRSKLYGWTETVALDADGNPCELALVDQAGTMIIPKGGTGMGLLIEDGTWVDRSVLAPVDVTGALVPLHPSSYDAPVELTTKAGADDLLDVNVTGVYQLEATPELLAAIGADIYTFEYFYRAGPTGSRAFVLVSNDTAFMLVGQPSVFEFIGLEAAADVDTDDEEDEELDDLDFGMM